MIKHLMIVPSTACPANCKYCFGPDNKGSLMDIKTFKKAIDWAENFNNNKNKSKREIVFHGGEPLMAGISFYKEALSYIRKKYGYYNILISMQSNLWLLDKALCQLFLDMGVSVGTSLDGPKDINDSQRGKGYFKKTFNNIQKAKNNGLNIGAICTFTKSSAKEYKKIFDFFLKNKLDFSIHTAVKSLGNNKTNHFFLHPENFGEILVSLLKLYLKNIKNIKISTLDALIKSISTGQGGICTFNNCLGDYLAISPNGNIYPCQRFVGIEMFYLGNINNNPTIDDLKKSPPWRILEKREKEIEKECSQCPYFSICQGGCPYNALAWDNSQFKNFKDPYCKAYKKIFSYITNLATKELFSNENLEEIINNPNEKSLFRQGAILSLMKNKPHPKEIQKREKSIIYAAALGTNKPIEEIAHNLLKINIASTYDEAIRELLAMKSHLKPNKLVNNLYLHITFNCNLKCSHCYAEAGNNKKTYGFMAVDDIISLCYEAKSLGFRQVVITGGEPLVHPNIKKLIYKLKNIIKDLKPLLIVLRTNLTLPWKQQDLINLGQSFDKIAISIDGDKESHNSRRGKGTYEKTLSNLKKISEDGFRDKLILSSILSVKDALGKKGEAVKELARKLKIPRTNFKPILPLGRAREMEIETIPETHWAYMGRKDAISYGFTPMASCGIGQNLYVTPKGDSFPCYAYSQEEWKLGNITKDGNLKKIIKSKKFKDLLKHNVDTNEKCKDCFLRYICSGACRAWSGIERKNMDSPPKNCENLYKRALSLLKGALENQGVLQHNFFNKL